MFLLIQGEEERKEEIQQAVLAGQEKGKRGEEANIQIEGYSY